MVFESVFANLLNTYLSDFIDDVSASQLKLGALKGNIALRNLAVKQNAFESLRLPFHVMHGHVGSLVMKIPWMSLYTSPVIIELKDIFVVCVPNVESSYDEEFEEQKIQSEKQKQLQSIDEAIKKAALKSASSQVPEDAKNDDFVTKTVAQIIKNLEITIENVHIVYEDKFTYPKVPFSVGITLSKLLFKTEETLKKAAKFSSSKPENCIFKQVKLEYLSAYWNCSPSEFISESDEEIRDDLLRDSIPGQNRIVTHLNYILEPNIFSANTIINRKPEVDKFSMPLLDLDMVLDQLCFCFNRTQFESFLMFLDAINRIQVANMFRKWRPKQSICENPKAWWHFAITSVLERDIRRRNKEWSWAYMKNHRANVKRYREVYTIKLLKTNFTKDAEKEIDELEKKMDVFSIALARNDAEKAVNEERKKQEALNPPKPKEQKGWFASWWGGKESVEQKEQGVVDQFKSELTTQEKLKFYEAIGYEESTGPTVFPPDFVAHLVNLNLKTFKFIVVDVTKGERILQFTLDGMKTAIHHRPASNGLILTSTIQALMIYGCKGVVMADEQLKNDSLLKLTVELNPLSKKFDYGLDLKLKPIKMIFDALTVNTLLEIVSPPEDVSFDELQTLAAIKMSEFREMSVTGLEYAIEQHKQLSVNIDVEPSFIVVPENGNIRDCVNVLLLCLGRMKIISHLIDKNEVKNIRKMSEAGNMISQYREKAYERYALSVEQIQVLLSTNTHWKDDIVASQSEASIDSSLNDRRLIEPIAISLGLMRAIVSDDPEMPNLKVSCDIPSLYIKASDLQINELISLATSIPTSTPKSDLLDVPKYESASLARAKQANEALKVVEVKPETMKTISETQLTEIQLNFSVGSLVVDLRARERHVTRDMLKMKALNIDASVEKKTFNLSAEFKLREIKVEAFDELHGSENPFTFLETSQISHLLQIKYEFCAQNSPLFKDTVQEVEIKMSEISFSVSRPVLTSVLVWSQGIVNRLPKIEPPPEPPRERKPSVSLRTRASSFASLTNVGLKPKRTKPRKEEDGEVEISNFAVYFEIQCFDFNIESICSIAFKGFNCDLKLTALEKVIFDASWEHFEVVNKIANTLIYEYIIQSESKKVLEMGVVMYPSKDVEEKKSPVDIMVKVNFGRLKVVFLNKFVTELLSFLNVFEAAKAKAIDASSAAAVYAKQSAVNAMDAATKIGLNLVLEAPNIIIPRNWESKQYLLLDLGKVVVKNDIKSTPRLILDTINCELTSTRIAVVTDDSLQSLDNILAPISFSVKITRNLSFDTNKSQPELNISATLHDIQLCIAQCDLKLAMQILSENIAAGASVQTLQEPVKALESAVQDRKPSALPEATKSVNLHSSVIVEEAVVHVDAVQETLQEPIYVKFNFDFLLPRITLVLFDGNSKVDDAKLCELLLTEFECYGVIRTNETIHAGLSMSNVVVSDVRKARKDTGIRKIVSAKHNIKSENEKSGKMLSISYTQQNDAYVDVNMSGFTVILALDYLLHVTNVITTGLGTETVESTTSTQAAPSILEPVQKDTENMTASAKQATLMVVDCKMSQSDIILIECIDKTDCPAVILNSFVEIGLKQHEERLHFNGKIANIRLGITNFEKYMKNDNDIEAYILQPTELNVIAAINGPTQHFDVMFSDINICISPNTVQLLLSILSSLGTTETEAKDDESSLGYKEVNSKSFFAPQKITDAVNYWFLKPVVSPAFEATEENLSTPSTPSTPTFNNTSPFLVVQQVVLTVETLSLVIESGGIDSQPMLKFQSKISGNFDNWNKLNLTFSCFMDYYNERLYVWEPMIEPVEKCTVWSFDLTVDIVDNGDSTSTYNAMIESRDRLELTLSKASLGVLMSCGDAFANAVKKSEKLANEHAIIISNELGIDLFIFVAAAKFKCSSEELQPKKENEMICVRIPTAKVGNFHATSSEMYTLESDSDINFRLIAGDHQIERSVSLRTKEKRCFNFPIVSYPGKEWKYLIDMSQRDSNTKNIVFHSTVEVTNKFHKSLELYYIEENEPKLFSKIKSQQKLFLPLRVVYHPSQKIFVKPSNDYCTPATGISWESKHAPNKYMNIKCESKKGLADFYVRVKQTIEDLLFEESQLWSDQSFCFKFELLPPFKLRNLLPIPVKYSIDGIQKEWSLSPGQEHDISHVDLKHTSMKIKLENYLNRDWVARKTLPSKWTNEDQVEVWTYNGNGDGITMDLAMNYSTQDESGIRIASIFSPFWMINKTNLTVLYKVGDSVIKHETDLTVPALVCFKPKTLFSKKKLALAFADSKWSDEFSIDAVGNKGTVVAKGKGKSKMSFCASIDIELSSFSLTKIVTVSPFYSIQNKTVIDLQVSEDNDEWVTVNSKTSKALWPKNAKDNKLYFRLTADAVSSHPISLEDTNSVLLVVGDQLINVHVEISDSGVAVQAYNYFDGSAAVRIFNATTDLSIDYGQHCISRRNRIPPMSSCYFTWHEPMLRRILVWSSPECAEMFLELDKDAIGEASNNLFWVTFLDAKQRILLITRDFEMAKNALHAGELAKPLYNAVVSLRGIGISLVNNDIHQELIYIGIYSSGVVWEVSKHKTKKFKALSVKQNETIETAYQKELLRRRVTNDLVITDTADRPSIVNLTNSLKVDLTDLKNPTMIEPIRGLLRRSSSLGFWCSVGMSPHVFQLHLKINRIQIDNQADDCFFGIIMCPVTPPKSLAQDRAPKAFIEISALIQRQAYMHRFKFLSILIQEFLIQIDGDFLMALGDFFASSKRKKDLSYEKMIEDDLKQAFGNETIIIASDVALSNKNYYDLIHFSPIKVHVSFALGNAASFDILGMFDFLIKSAGVTLTEFKDVLFKIDFFEKKNVLLSQDELTSLAVSHYARQVLKQFYVIVLGLDVIGNPVGLFLGLKQGVGDFFYEPVVGIIEGPEEFAEGLAIGFKSLFSHTVGGAAGALGRITGTLSQGLSSLTMDEEDKRRRRETLNRKQTFSQSGKNLAKGFFSGVTGLVTKPWQGAKQQGLEGLVKGVGRGVVGVVAQPATGVIDFASGSLNALQKAVDINAEAKKQRPARHIHKDGVIRPYNRYEAEGRSLLRELNKGEYADTDTYIAHSMVLDGTLLITDKNILYLKQTCLFKNIEVEWCEPYENIANIEIVNNTDIKISLREQTKRLGGLMSGEFERIVACQSPDIAASLSEIIAKERK